MRTLIAEHAIPGTKSTVKIELIPGHAAIGPEYYWVTREAGDGFNFLGCAASTEAEARKAANDLWTDARNRAAALTWDPFQANQLRKTSEMADRPEITEGFWNIGERIFKVQRSLTSGHLYAKELTESGWSYAPGAMRELKTLGSELTAEVAARYGKLYGVCCLCGRTLTNEESIAAGIGPVCAGRQGW